MKLIVGLGNPGKQYENTRHNIGFIFADYFAKRNGIKFKTDNKAELAAGEINGEKFILLKPQTFMNLSGQAVCEVVSYKKIEINDILVIHDDIDLPAFDLRIKRGGSDGGHNGLKSITECIGNNYYIRVRMGIGRPQNLNMETSDWVLSKFSKDFDNNLETCFSKIDNFILNWIADGFEKANSLFNNDKSKINIPKMTESESLVADLCRKTFLSLWSYPCPKRKDNKNELCDLLVVCEPDIIIFSVKNINIKSSNDENVDQQRWDRRAVHDSVDQIYGAERALCNKTEILDYRLQKKIDTSFYKAENTYRVIVALGRGDRFNLQQGEFQKGFVHSLDEDSLDIILNELDTITDFIDYLKNKEAFCTSNTAMITYGEEDVLSLYLREGRRFPDKYNLVHLDMGSWKGFSSSKTYLNKKEADKISYAWDKLIEIFSEHINNKTLLIDSKQSEKALRVLAKENRFSRRILSNSIYEFTQRSKLPGSRTMKSPSGVVYVYMQQHCKENDLKEREIRIKNLQLRCWVAKSLHKDASLFIGIATEPLEPGIKFSYDLLYVEKPDWTNDDEKALIELNAETKYLDNLKKESKYEDEYPKE